MVSQEFMTGGPGTVDRGLPSHGQTATWLKERNRPSPSTIQGIVGPHDLDIPT